MWKPENINKIKTPIISVAFSLSFQMNIGYAETPRPVSPDALIIEKPRLPDITPGPLPRKPKFTLPDLKAEPAKDPQLSSAFSVFIKQIKLTGCTIFSKQELKQITQPYENRAVSNQELQVLKHTLTRYYIDHGYINSGVILPDQQVKDGIIRLQVIEGELTEFTINGNDWLRSSYIDDRVRQSFAIPLNVKEVQDRLYLLQQDPLIERINAELRPGLKPGQSRMNLSVTEARPYQVGFVVANDHSPSIGGVSGKLWLRHNNLTGYGDALNFSYTAMEGLDAFSGSYSVPLSAYDTRLNLYYQNSESDIIDKSSDDISIHSHAQTYGISLAQPLYRTHEQTFSVSLAFEYRFSKIFIDSKPFLFSTGEAEEEAEDAGESKISVLRFTQEWLDRDQTQVIAARSTFNLGINTLGATNNSDGTADGQFFTWLGQFQWIKGLPWLNSQIHFHADIQLAHDSLLPLEKFSIGGRRSVRGYRENQFVRDKGAITSLEWRVPVFRLPIPGLSHSIADSSVQLATFADFGWSENIAVVTEDSKTIASWGLGVLWDPSPKIHTEFYWGVPFRSIQNKTGYDLQDSGIHFQVNAQY